MRSPAAGLACRHEILEANWTQWVAGYYHLPTLAGFRTSRGAEADSFFDSVFRASPFPRTSGHRWARSFHTGPPPRLRMAVPFELCELGHLDLRLINAYTFESPSSVMAKPKDTTTPPSRDFGYDMRRLRTSPGARKEKLRERRYQHPHGNSRGRGRSQRYAELHAVSAFSFLDGSSQPEDLVERAAALDLQSVALVDRMGVYGSPRFHKAAEQAGLRALVGAELVFADPNEKKPRKKSTRRESSRRAADGESLVVLVKNAKGYRNLCRLLTAAARDRPKGDARVTWPMLKAHAAGLHCLTGGAGGAVARALTRGGIDDGRKMLERLLYTFNGRVHLELQRHHLRAEERRNQALLDLGGRLRIPLLATNGVRYAKPADKPLHDVLTCLRHYTHLDQAGRHLEQHRESHFKSAAEMSRLFRDLPAAVEESARLAEELDFTLAGLGYRFPRLPSAPRRDQRLLPATDHLERGPGAVSPLHRPRPGPDRERAGGDREARARRLLPDRLGHRALLPEALDLGPGAWLGGQ